MAVTALLVALACAAPATAQPRGATCAHAAAQFGQVSVERLERAIVCEVNRVRAGRGLNAVRPVASLRRAALRHARDMARRDYFDHTSLGGTQPADRALRSRYLRGHSWIIGEVLAWGTLEETTAVEVVRSWMASPPHRAVLVDGRFRDIGVGAARGLPLPGTRGGATFAAEFGRL